MEKVIANTRIGVNVYCPHCNTIQDIYDLEDVKYSLKDYRAEECDIEVECVRCNNTFLVTDIEY